MALIFDEYLEGRCLKTTGVPLRNKYKRKEVIGKAVVSMKAKRQNALLINAFCKYILLTFQFH